MITSTGQPIMIRPRRSIGGLYPDVVLEEAHEDTLEITEHPVEHGAPISDYAYMQPATVMIRAGVSDSSANNDSPRPSLDFYNKLLELQAARELFDIVTGKRLYKNMLLARLSAIGDAQGENALLFTAECREVPIAHVQAATVPQNRLHRNPGATSAEKDKGQQQAKRVENASILERLIG